MATHTGRGRKTEISSNARKSNGRCNHGPIHLGVPAGRHVLVTNELQPLGQLLPLHQPLPTCSRFGASAIILGVCREAGSRGMGWLPRHDASPATPSASSPSGGATSIRCFSSKNSAPPPRRMLHPAAQVVVQATWCGRETSRCVGVWMCECCGWEGHRVSIGRKPAPDQPLIWPRSNGPCRSGGCHDDSTRMHGHAIWQTCSLASLSS